MTFEERVIEQLTNLAKSLDSLEQRVAALESHQSDAPQPSAPRVTIDGRPSASDSPLTHAEKRELLNRMLRNRQDPRVTAPIVETLSQPHEPPPAPSVSTTSEIASAAGAPVTWDAKPHDQAYPPERMPEHGLMATPAPPFVWSVRDPEPEQHAAPIRPPPRSEHSQQAPPSLETRIGGRWFAIAGAIAILIAIVLFLKLAYGQGWLGRVAPAYRCLTGGVFGLLLLASGEVARRKINAWAAVGLFSSGVAGLYASVLAAHGMYDLLSNGAAFVLLAAVSGVGIATGARTRLPVVSIVSLAGAYLAPFLLDAPDPNPLVFPLYALAILAAGLWLAAWLRGGFRPVGTVVWWGTLVLGGLWAAQQRGPDAGLAIGFLLVAWVMMHASHVFAARAPEERDLPPSPLMWRHLIPQHQVWMLASSFSSSAWAATLSVWLATRTGVLPTWLTLFVMAATAAAVAVGLIPSWSLLREIPRTARERLSVALLVQAGALTIAGTAQATVGISAVPVWCALGLAAIVSGRLIHARALDLYGTLALGIGTLRYFTWDCWRNDLFAPLHQSFGLVISEALWWGLGIGAAWVVASVVLLWRLPATSRLQPRPLACGAMGVALLTIMAGVVHPGSEATSITIVWAALGVVGIVLGNIGRRLLLTELSLGVLAVASGKALLGDSSALFGPRESGAHLLGLVYSPWMLACLVLSGASLVTALLVPPRLVKRAPEFSWGRWIGPGAALLAALFAAVAALHPDAAGPSIGIYWVLLGLFLVVFAPWRPALWLHAIGLLALCAALGRLIVIEGLQGLPKDGIAWQGLFLTDWCLAMSLGAVAWLLTGVILSCRTFASRLDARVPWIAGAASLVMLGLSVVHPQAAATSVLWVWIALSWVAFLGSPLRRALKLDWSASGAAIACGLLWMIAYVLPERHWSGSSYWLLLHPGLWSALLIAALFATIARLGLIDLSTDSRRTVRVIAAWLAVVLVWASTSFEAARVGAAITGEQTVQLAFVSIWWAVCAVALVLAGFKANIGAARRAGLALMAVAMLKVVLFDMGGVPQVWRIASFLFLGLLMIGVAMGYARVAGRLLPREPE